MHHLLIRVSGYYTPIRNKFVQVDYMLILCMVTLWTIEYSYTMDYGYAIQYELWLWLHYEPLLHYVQHTMFTLYTMEFF